MGTVRCRHFGHPKLRQSFKLLNAPELSEQGIEFGWRGVHQGVLTLQDIPDRLSGLSQVKLEPRLLVGPEEALESLIPVFWLGVVTSSILFGQFFTI